MRNYWIKSIICGCAAGLALSFLSGTTGFSVFLENSHAADSESSNSADTSPALVITELTPEVLTDEQTITISGSASGFSGNFSDSQLQVFLTQTPLQSMEEVDSFIDAGTDSSDTGEAESTSFSRTLIANFSVSDFASDVSSTGDQEVDDTADTNVYDQADGSLEFSIQISANSLPYLSWGQWGPFGLEVTLTDSNADGSSTTATIDDVTTLTGRTILLRYSQSVTTTGTGSVATTNIAVLVYEQAGTVDTSTGKANSSVSTVSVRDGVSFAVSPTFLYSSGLNDEQSARRDELLASATDLVVTTAGEADLGLLTAATAALGQDSAAAELLQLAADSKTLDTFGDSHPELADLVSNPTATTSSTDSGSNTQSSKDADTSSEDISSASSEDTSNTSSENVTNATSNEITANILTNYVTASTQWFGADLFTLGTDQVYLAPSRGLEQSASSLVTPTSALRILSDGTQTYDDAGMTVLDSWSQAAQLLAENPESTEEQLLNRQKLRALSALLTNEDLSDQRTMFVHLAAEVQDSNLDSRLAALLDNPWVNGISISEAADSAISTVERQAVEAVDASSLPEVSETLEQLLAQYDQAQSVVEVLYRAGSTLEVVSSGFSSSSQVEQSEQNSDSQSDSNQNQNNNLNGSNTDFSGNNFADVDSNEANTSSSGDSSDANASGETTGTTEENSNSATGDTNSSTNSQIANSYKDIYLHLTATVLFPLSTLSTTTSDATATDTDATTQINQQSEIALDSLNSTSDFIQAESTQITLINSSASLPFTITSQADVPLEVQVELVTSDPRLQAQNSVSVTLNPHSSTTVEIPVTAVGNADVTVQINVTSSNGVTLDQSSLMNVRVYANWEDTLMVVVSCILVVLFVGGLIRTIRRGRRRTYE